MPGGAKMAQTKLEVYEHKKKMYRMKQLRATNYLGGKCAECGNQDQDKLQFHHVNKGARTSVPKLFHGSWENIKKELKKCVLLCEECHVEFHRLDKSP
jgi:5-methylcytosine-specific restriction endonuclease McrA